MSGKRTESRDARRMTSAPRQRGVVLFVALIVLIVMTLAGLAMMRQMATGVSIAGNVAFKESTTSVADAGTEVAFGWYTARSQAVLSNNDYANGYDSSWGAPNADPASYFSAASVLTPMPVVTASGEQVRYVIHRLCLTQNMPSNAPAQRCADTVTANSGASVGGASLAPGALPPPRPFYRVTTEVRGPRNTLSYIQVIGN